MKKTMLSIVAVLALLAGAKSAHASYDGTPSTGSFSIVTNASLAAASASGTLTVVDTAALSGTVVTVGAYQYRAGRDFAVGASTNATAANLAAAITASAQNLVTASALAGDNHVTLTGLSAGTLYNGVGLKTSASGEISVSGATLSGGLDNAVVTINGVQLVQGRDWFVADVGSNTAIGLAGAINANPSLAKIISAQPVSTAVFLRSLFSPVAYSMSSSAGAALTASQAAMSGGTQGLLLAGAPQPCFLGTVAALPSNNYPAGCLLYLQTDATHLYISTKTLTGAEAGSAYWLAK